MAAWAKDQGSSLFELLHKIHQEFGLFQESLISITKKGKSGAEEINQMMVNFRQSPPAQLAGSNIEKLIDYSKAEEKNLKSGEIKKIDFPTSNVLQFITEDGSKVSVRPSGTEPKIKFYFSVNTSVDQGDQYDGQLSLLNNKIKQIIKDLDLE